MWKVIDKYEKRRRDKNTIRQIEKYIENQKIINFWFAETTFNAKTVKKNNKYI